MRQVYNEAANEQAEADAEVLNDLRRQLRAAGLAKQQAQESQAAAEAALAKAQRAPAPPSLGPRLVQPAVEKSEPAPPAPPLTAMPLLLNLLSHSLLPPSRWWPQPS